VLAQLNRKIGDGWVDNTRLIALRNESLVADKGVFHEAVGIEDATLQGHAFQDCTLLAGTRIVPSKLISSGVHVSVWLRVGVGLFELLLGPGAVTVIVTTLTTIVDVGIGVGVWISELLPASPAVVFVVDPCLAVGISIRQAEVE
jgi:hypothetical protein